MPTRSLRRSLCGQSAAVSRERAPGRGRSAGPWGSTATAAGAGRAAGRLARRAGRTGGAAGVGDGLPARRTAGAKWRRPAGLGSAMACQPIASALQSARLHRAPRLPPPAGSPTPRQRRPSRSEDVCVACATARRHDGVRETSAARAGGCAAARRTLLAECGEIARRHGPPRIGGQGSQRVSASLGWSRDLKNQA